MSRREEIAAAWAKAGFGELPQSNDDYSIRITPGSLAASVPLWGTTRPMLTPEQIAETRDEIRRLREKSAEMAAIAEAKRAPPPSLSTRYATFRATVERIVREEAPAARVVTDHADGKFIAWLTLPHVGEQAILFPLQWEWDDMEWHVREQLKLIVRDVTAKAGRAALGAK